MMSCSAACYAHTVRMVNTKSERIRKCVPSSIDPTDDISTESKRVAGVAQPVLRTLENCSPVDEPELSSTSRPFKTCLGALQERLRRAVVESVLLNPARAITFLSSRCANKTQEEE